MRDNGREKRKEKKQRREEMRKSWEVRESE